MIKVIRKSIVKYLCSSKISKPLVDYKQRGQFRSPLQLKMGDKIQQFQVIQRHKLEDFSIDCAVLKCQKFGTQWVHFDCQQQKNSIGFILKSNQAPTVIMNSLQKIIQCGSKKYPVRNPIEHMTRRSFNPQNYSYVTNDHFFYGYQTQLLTDHKNLMSVFLHMMFNPLLRQQDFKQHVWRYELRDPEKLQINGDIANEMFATWNYSQTQIYDAIQKHMFNKHGYGKRNEIVKVSHSDIVQWHKKIFKPENLLIISHGDLHPTKIIHNYRQITAQFKWKPQGVPQGKHKKQKVSLNNNAQQSLQESKTVNLQHLDSPIPLMLSFKLQNISQQERILLPILSYILFDMPNGLLMHWNTLKTPYPKHYGFQGNHFNIGITLQPVQNKHLSENEFLQQQKLIRINLQNLYKNKIPNALIQQCLYHLQSEYYSRDGIKIMQGCIDNILSCGTQTIEKAFNVKSIINKTLRNYRKDNIFQQLLRKHIIDNKKYIRMWGKQNYQLIEDLQFQQAVKLKLVLRNLNPQQIQSIKSYRPGNILQDYRVLPKININQLQIFEQRDPKIFQINKIPVYFNHKCDGIKIVIKYDITDIQEDQIKLIPIICEAFPWMGAKGISSQAFDQNVGMFIRNISMNFQSCRAHQGMKLYLYLNIQFSQRNSQFGFNLCTNLINDHNYQNIQVLSNRIQRKASQTYNDLTGNLIQYHGRHIAGTRSPYAMIEDPIFMARSTCSIATDILKISNPKQILYLISYQLRKITHKFTQKQRLSVLFECRRQNLQKYKKYLQMMLNPLKQGKIKLQAINDKGFTPNPCLKYFPNYGQQYVFQSFSVPYYQNLEDVPASLVLSSVINHNIRQYNPSGGCFLFKGAMISYLRGTRKKLLQLENYYKQIQQIEQAKRYLFQQFRRYTAADIFYTGIKAQEARNFKQAVAIVDQKSIQACLQKYILSTLKEGKSSILAVGPHISNYQPMIKKGWTIQRSVQDMSLGMQSSSQALPRIEMSKYINIY